MVIQHIQLSESKKIITIIYVHNMITKINK